MDIISHGLWGAAAAKALNRKKSGPKLKLWQATFWGMFPDLFAFTIPFVWLIYALITGTMTLSEFPGPDTAPAVTNARFPIFNLAAALYNLSHSLVIFAAVILIIWLLKRKIYYVLIGWPLHILLDIPTHTAEFYPTPVFWPVSNWQFTHGFSWAEGWFMITNYSLLLIVFLWLRRKTIEKKT